MKKLPIIIGIIIIALIIVITLSYNSYLTILSTTGQVVSPTAKKQAAGIAVAVSLAIIGLIGYLSSRAKAID